MGYSRINQYANVTEIFEYQRDINFDSKRTRKAKLKKYNNKLYYAIFGVPDKKRIATRKKQKQEEKERQLKQGTYKRKESSIKRSRDNFFRLCHHNVYLAETVHFVTLTFAYDLSYKEACRHVARFMEKISKLAQPISISYISVPELTKENRYHFHLLVFNLPPELSGEPRWYKTRKKHVWYTTERETRNLQRHFERGYVDIVPARHTSTGIAGYMAKYMGKALDDTRYETIRGYNCSRNIEKIRSAGGNTFSQQIELIKPVEDIYNCEIYEYDVPYLGHCKRTKITTIKK